MAKCAEISKTCQLFNGVTQYQLLGYNNGNNMYLSQIPPELSLCTPGHYSQLISNCISVPFVHHCPVVYCSNVRWSCEYLCCVVLDFVPRILCRWLRVSSRVIIIVWLCLYSRYSSLFCLGLNPVFCIVFVWSPSPCLYMARCNLDK